MLCYNIDMAVKAKKEESSMADEREDVVVLLDENGEEVEFEHLDTIEMNGNEYVVLLPMDQDTDENDDDEIDEVVILRIEHSEDGEDSFVTVDDDDELNEVFEEFRIRMEEEYDDIEE